VSLIIPINHMAKYDASISGINKRKKMAFQVLVLHIRFEQPLYKRLVEAGRTGLRGSFIVGLLSTMKTPTCAS
jgi:hypothetical protein